MQKYLFLLVNVWLLSTAFAQHAPIPEERWKLVDQYLGTQKDFSAMVMLGSAGKIIINRGYGYADRSEQVPFSDQTLYTIGSITKPFTSTAIMVLMEQGKLTPEDQIDRYFDGVPDDKKEITLHQLLTHSSGLPGDIGDDYEAISDATFQKRTWDESLLFKPGEGYEYSNVGYSLLGIIVEKITAMKYNDFLLQNIFKPAGMKTAGYHNPNADYHHLAHGYLSDGTDWGTSLDKPWDGREPFWNLKANGGLLMSAQDMYQWYLSLRENRVLSPASLKRQITPYVNEGGGSFYGYGYALDEKGESVQHNGSNRIFKADFRWYPKADLFLFSATNDANVRLFRINDEIMNILLTGQLPDQDNWVEIPMSSFPADENQYASQALVEMIQTYSVDKGEGFIAEFLSKGILDRNGSERLHELFQMLHQDVGNQPIEAIYSSGNKLQVVMPAKEHDAKLKIIISFIEHKIDRLGAEIGT